MKKVIRLTESDLRKLIDNIISEQQVNQTSLKAWEGLKARMTTAYYYEEPSENELTFKFDKYGDAVVTFTPSSTNPSVGTLAMTIKFNNPNVVKQNGPVIAKIQSLLGTRFNNNVITANRPQGYLTQTINSVANMLFNVIKFDGNTWVNVPSDVIVDKGEISGNDFRTN